jgi:hypothetical protein
LWPVDSELASERAASQLVPPSAVRLLTLFMTVAEELAQFTVLVQSPKFITLELVLKVTTDILICWLSGSFVLLSLSSVSARTLTAFFAACSLVFLLPLERSFIEPDTSMTTTTSIGLLYEELAASPMTERARSYVPSPLSLIVLW